MGGLRELHGASGFYFLETSRGASPDSGDWPRCHTEPPALTATSTRSEGSGATKGQCKLKASGTEQEGATLRKRERERERKKERERHGQTALHCRLYTQRPLLG